MINQTPTENVDLEYADRSALVQKYEDLKSLMEDERFKRLILDGYLKEKAIEFTSLLATDYVRQSGTRGAIMEELVAISAFEGYLLAIERLGAPVEDDEEFEG